MTFPVNGYVQGNALAVAASGSAINLETDAFDVSIFTDSAGPGDRDAIETYDVGDWATANEVTSSATAFSPATLTAAEVNVGTGLWTFGDSSADLAWSDMTWTDARGLVVYSTTAATDLIVCAVDFGADMPVTAGTFTVTWDTTDKIFKVTF